MRYWILAALAVLAGGGAAASARAEASARAHASGPLTPWAGAGLVAAPGGPSLTDSLGRRLQLHGVNLVAKCGGGAVDTTASGTPCVGPARGPRLAFVLSPTARDPGRRFTASDAATLARLGFDVVRLGIIWQGLEPGPRGVGANDPRFCAAHAPGTPYPALKSADPYNAAVLQAYLRRTDRIVRLLADAGIRVILDMHQDAWGSAFANRDSPLPWNGEGAPPWATCTDGAQAALPPAWNAAYGVAPVEAAIHHFFANDVRSDLQGQFARVWRAVARHYRPDDDVVGYEVYNEPADFASAATADAELQCFYGGPVREPASCRASGSQAPRGGVIGAIQSVDSRHVVFFEPQVTTDFGAAETIGITEPLRFDRVALAFHVYSPPTTTLALVASERARTQTRQPGGPPWIMDEFGASSDTASTAETVAAAGLRNLSWSYWSGLQLHDPTGGPLEALLDEHTRRPDSAKAVALAVPYPAATAGTPGPEAYAPAAHVFRYRYRADHAITAPTAIVVPTVTYPLGYRVGARGARVTSAPNAPVLALVAAPGARTVTVSVRPR